MAGHAALRLRGPVRRGVRKVRSRFRKEGRKGPSRVRRTGRFVRRTRRVGRRGPRLRKLRLLIVAWLLVVWVILPMALAAMMVSDASETIADVGGLVTSAGLAQALMGGPTAPGGGCAAADEMAERIAEVDHLGGRALDGRAAAAIEDAVAAYCSAAAAYGVDWAVLAGVGFMECTHGLNREPGCDPGPPPTVNADGARGPMQFLGSAWRCGADDHDPDVAGPPVTGSLVGCYGTDGDDDGIADPWSWPDAAHSAARYLVRLGVGDDPARAAFHYFHGPYTTVPFDPHHFYPVGVLAAAERYREAVGELMPVLPGGCPIEPRGGTEPYVDERATAATVVMANAVSACLGREHDLHCWRPNPPTYEHPRGRACDFMLSSGGIPGDEYRRRGELMAEWVAAHAAELNVLYVIWWDRSWNPSLGNVPWEEWPDYTNCANPCTDPSAGHYNHIHVSVQLMPDDPRDHTCASAWAAGLACSE